MARVQLLGDFSEVPDLPFGHDAPTVEGELTEAVALPDHLAGYRLYRLGELGHFKPVSWLIKQRLAVGESHVLWGKGDSYKSFLALHWSMTLAYAGMIVIYVVAEGASGMVARVEAWKKTRGADHDASGMLFMPNSVPLHDSRAVSRWIDALRLQLGEWYSLLPESQRHPALVVFDTVARNFVGGDESSPRDMGLFVDGVEQVRRGLGCATLCIHHSDKQGINERGTESLRNSCFAMYHLEKMGVASGAGGLRAKLSCDRMKDFEPPPATLLDFKVADTGLKNSEGEAVASLVINANEKLVIPVIATKHHERSANGASGKHSNNNGRGSQIKILSQNETKVLEWFMDIGVDVAVGVTEVCHGVAVGREPVRRACRSLVKQGLLNMVGTTKDRQYWLINEVEW